MVNLLGFSTLYPKVNLVNNGVIMMVIMDKTTRAARMSSVKIPYLRARLAVAKVVDI